MRFEIAGNGIEIFRERDCMMFEASFTGFCEKEGALQARYLKTSGAAQQKLVLFGAAPCCSVLVWLESLRFTEAFHTSLMEPAGSSDVPCRFMRVCESASGAPLYMLCDHHL